LTPADLVDLAGEVPGLGGAGQVAGDDSRGVRGEVAERRRPRAAAGVQDNVMAFTDEGTGGGAAEPVGGAGDEDAGHGDNSSAGAVVGQRRLGGTGQLKEPHRAAQAEHLHRLPHDRPLAEALEVLKANFGPGAARGR
jgi:hypothetical protein